MPCSVLMLQGPIGPLFADLGEEMTRRGHRVTQVCFNGGDESFSCKWARRYRFRMSRDEWKVWLRHLIRTERPDCVVLFGDCRPLHRDALDLLMAEDIPAYIFEEGYFRPFYLTLERGGVNANSEIPRITERFVRSAPGRLWPQKKFRHVFIRRIWNCSLYYVMMALRAYLYPEYRHHRCPLFIREAAAWLRGWVRYFRYLRRDRSVIATLKPKSFFLVPLQVAGDSQVRFHSEFSSVARFIIHVVKGFARHAPCDTQLVVKHHPMDRGYRDYTQLLNFLVRHFGLQGRVLYVRDVPLPRLLSDARGVITINSTVGLSALIHGTPTKTLGRAIYAIPGLTDQRDLKVFWRDQQPVEASLLQRFQSYLMAKTQLVGTTATRGNDWDILNQFEEMKGKSTGQASAVVASTSRRQRKSGRLQSQRNDVKTTHPKGAGEQRRLSA